MTGFDFEVDIDKSFSKYLGFDLFIDYSFVGFRDGMVGDKSIGKFQDEWTRLKGITFSGIYLDILGEYVPKL